MTTLLLLVALAVDLIWLAALIGAMTMSPSR